MPKQIPEAVVVGTENAGRKISRRRATTEETLRHVIGDRDIQSISNVVIHQPGRGSGISVKLSFWDASDLTLKIS